MKTLVAVTALLTSFSGFAQQEGPEVQPSEEKIYNGSFYDHYPVVYYPTATHFLLAFSAFGESIEIEDGSRWAISSYDSYKILSWQTNDPLMISQNQSWFSDYAYRIFNQNRHSTVEANFAFYSFPGSEYAQRISHIDVANNYICLCDGNSVVSHWDMYTWDKSVYKNWEIGQPIILGANSGSGANYKALLINIAKNNHARAKERGNPF